jgi:hypothetical protein
LEEETEAVMEQLPDLYAMPAGKPLRFGKKLHHQTCAFGKESTSVLDNTGR